MIILTCAVMAFEIVFSLFLPSRVATWVGAAATTQGGAVGPSRYDCRSGGTGIHPIRMPSLTRPKDRATFF